MTITLPKAADVAAVQVLLRRYRIAVSVMFAIAGMIVGAWTARMPEIQHHLRLSDGRLSIALLAMACGGLLGMRTAGRLVDRHGTGRMMSVTSLALGTALAATAYAPNLATLGLALLTLGLLHGTLNVSMNAAAVVCQTAYGRPIMTSFHALFSIGGVAGAAASAAAHAYLSVGQTYIAVGAVLTVAAFVAIRQLAFAPHAEAGSKQRTSTARPDDGRMRRRVALLGLLAFCALISEGAAADWSSVYLDRLGASPAYAAAAYAAFAGCMTIGRLTGDRITAAVNPVALLRGCGLIAGAGLAAGILLGNSVAAIIGFACLGAGLSCVIPTLYSTAGNLDPSRPGAALSRVAALGYLGYVTGPVIIGAGAAHLGLGHSLLLLPALAGLLVTAAPVVRAAPPPARFDPVARAATR
jgi:fucose permease